MKAVAFAAIAACLSTAALAAPPAHGTDLPGGFRDTVVFNELEEPTAVRFSPDGRVFVAEKAGKILVFEGLGDETSEVFADLRTEVYDSGDRGLLGLALDPDFPTRPYVYALYTYDHILGGEGEEGKVPRWGTPDQSGDPCPKPEDADVDACPVSGRVVRLTADGDNAVAETSLVEGWCQQFSSHSVGALQFDSSGALYASGGDGASFTTEDYGQYGWPARNQCGDPPAGLGGIETPPTAEGGALRAQDARTLADPTNLNGSVIRIDPDTGEGLAGNPMFGSLDPNARRIVGYGFRNPFRFAIDSLTDEIYVGNVGWSLFEEIDRFAVSSSSAYNSGWPCFEGPGPNEAYESVGLKICNDLYEEPGAVSPPFFVYSHLSGVFPEDPCPSEGGAALSGMAVYRGGAFPDSYDGALFFADPIHSCIYVMHPGEDGKPDPATTTAFASDAGIYPGIDLEVGPEGDLYYVKLFGGENGTIHRISYDPGAPSALLTASPQWGDEDPFEVHLDASGSTDPDGEPLDFEWDLDGDGNYETSGGPTRTQTFVGATENQVIGVKVSDEDGKSSTARVTVYPGDTPPQPAIEEPQETLEWGVGQRVEFSGLAEDGEDGELPPTDLYWKTRLYHCPSACHAHPLQTFPAVDVGEFVAPDHDYPAYIEVILTATDSRGLSATDSVRIDPKTVDLEIASDPAGLALSAGLISEAAPFTLHAIEGSNVLLSAPATQQLGGSSYAWSGWSDGGERVHTLVADESAKYVASYTRLGDETPAPGDSPGGDGAAPPPQVAGPPQGARLSRHPAKKTRSSTARFDFSAGVGSTFKCKLDGQRFVPCRSPRTYRRLRPGRHRFEVVTVDALGNPNSLPQRFEWQIVCPRKAKAAAAAQRRATCAGRAGAEGRRGRL